jgi:tricarballylate dehydrogenase
VEVRYRHAVVELLRDGQGAVRGVVCATPDGRQEVRADAVVLACGGFEADAEMRAEHLGPGWQAAKVRGTAHNTGEGLRAALAAGARPYGDWAGCHSVFWDAHAPPTGDRELTNRLSRLSYPLGIVVNARAERFLDEGADLRNYTYARYGAEALRQPGAVAFQLFDAQTAPLLDAESYAAPGTSRLQADSLPALAAQLGLDPDALEATVRAFNAAIEGGPFDPTVKDGRRAAVTPPKSNWASPIAEPPFYAYPVTCGITFTFGGLRIDPDARVLDRAGRPIPGLYAAGELVGGLFYGNYPGGSGLTSGAVFGRRAGRSAAREVLERARA